MQVLTLWLWRSFRLLASNAAKTRTDAEQYYQWQHNFYDALEVVSLHGIGVSICVVGVSLSVVRIVIISITWVVDGVCTRRKKEKK